jgi:DNA-binding XRE family transcriptional regulator
VNGYLIAKESRKIQNVFHLWKGKKMMNVCIDTVKTGENIKKYRKAKKIPLFKIQKELGLGTVQAIYKWERGDCLPRIDNFFALCFLLEVSPMDICVFYDEDYAKGINAICKGV